MILRDIRPGEIRKLIRLEQLSSDYPWTINSLTASFEIGSECKAGADGGSDKGYFVLTHGPGFTEICNFVVFQAAKRQGYGKQFLEYIRESAIARGSDEIWLEVRQSNIAARNLYTGSGFSERGLRKNYYPIGDGHSEDAIMMTLVLTGDLTATGHTDLAVTG